MLKRLLLPIIAVTIALTPAINSQAAITPHVTYNGITFNSNASGNGCTGPIIGVYGSSALKTFVLKTAADYCAAQLADGIAAGSANDVEFTGGGDSCPGLDFAADDSTDPVVGTSDVFPGGCTGGFARSATLVTDNNDSVNIVEAITNCGGTVTSPQGGQPSNPGLVQCNGAAPVGAGGCASPLPAQTFPYPNDISVLAAQNLWNTASAQAPTDMGQLGGCPGFTPAVQLRVPGSGTRATWCFNLYGPGVDQCLGNATAPNQSGSGGLITHICGNPYSTPPTAPDDLVGTIGHTSRATVVVDPNNPAAGSKTDPGLSVDAPIQECGIVSLGGHSGWNQKCDPKTTTVNFGFNSDGVKTCNGDLEIVAGNYPTWGYEHFFVHKPLSSANNTLLNAPATTTPPNPGGYITFVKSTAEATLVQSFGFMRGCQMQVARTVDAGPYSLTAGATC